VAASNTHSHANTQTHTAPGVTSLLKYFFVQTSRLLEREGKKKREGPKEGRRRKAIVVSQG